MTVKHISCLLEFCLRTTYFTFQGRLYEHVKVTAMWCPISPIVANLFMKDLETKDLATAPLPPTLWKRYVMIPLLSSKNHRKMPSLNT